MGKGWNGLVRTLGAIVCVHLDDLYIRNGVGLVCWLVADVLLGIVRLW